METPQLMILLHPPTYNFFEWRVLEANFQEGDPSRHLVGRTENNIRVSSPISVVDEVLRSCVTYSRNMYRLVGMPGPKLGGDLAELWKRWERTNGVVSAVDVTDEVLALFGAVDEELGFCNEVIPEDFPQDYFLGAVPGEQLKFLARDIGRRYVVGPTQAELGERYELCRRLAAQYFRLHLNLSEADLPPAASGQSLPEAYVYVALARWNLSPGERRWISDRIHAMQR